MSWYRDDDGTIISDDEFYSDCCECSMFCQETRHSVPCNGERTDCPYFKEVDTSEYDKKIYNKAIDDFFQELEKYEYKDGWLRLKMSSIYQIAEELKAGGIE